MEEKFNWDLPADPDPKSDNYYNGIVSKELKDFSNMAETLLGDIRRESVKNQSDFVNEGIETILDRLGIKSDKPPRERRNSWLSSGLRLAQCGRDRGKSGQNQLPPDPMEMAIMRILKSG